MDFENPHFDRPFRVGRSVATVEQDSDEELLNCAWAILSTEVGTRDELPEFGVEELPFRSPDFVRASTTEAVREWEPRLEATSEAEIEELIMNVEVEVSDAGI
jgi:phage baseplate assembly protein W